MPEFQPIEVDITPNPDFQPIEVGDTEAAPVAAKITKPTTGEKEH